MFTEEQKQLIDKLSNIDNIVKEINSLFDKTNKKNEEVKEKTNKKFKEIERAEHDLNKLIEEKSKGFPWLADAIAQYYEMRDLKISEFLEQKLTPAISSAERVRQIAKEKKVLQKQFRITRNFIRYYESLFPWLTEFVGENVDELIEQVVSKEKEQDMQYDPVKFYLTKGEYEKLSVTERNQRALDRYWAKKKSSWELGRDYERYIGYLYEEDGFSVYYQGIEAGLEDLGRDLIAQKNNELKVIQCKYWAQHKTIHEKHICQLFGTTLKYWIEQKNVVGKQKAEEFISLIKQNEIKGVFATSTKLSDTAKAFANELGIEVKENFPFQRYSSIKCNISRKSGEKIYHLPIDQQYDKTIIEKERNERYVETVAEAESLGFRRAWKWKGTKE